MNEDEIIEIVKKIIKHFEYKEYILNGTKVYKIIQGLLDLYQKEKEKNKELEEENTRQQELLGNIHQNYRDKIIKIQEQNEELDEKFKYAVPDEIVDELYTSKDKIKDKIKEVEELDMGYEGKWVIDLLEELLEENNGK